MKEIPADKDDWQYHQSFTLEELEVGNEAASFFNEFGFVVVRDVIGMRQCEEVIDDMVALLKAQDPEVERDDPTTWNRKLGRFGMPYSPTKPLFRPSLLRLRQNERVCRSFASVLGAQDPTEVVCSHDRWLLHRPAGRHKEWMSPKNVHLDCNPFIVDDPEHSGTVMKRLESLRYCRKDLGEFIAENNDVHSSMGLCVQGLVNLRDQPIGCGGGGTLVVPGSHKQGAWPPLRHEEAQTGPMQYGFDRSVADQAQCIGLRAGSLLIWNQRTIHGSTPNMRPGLHELRAAVPMRFFHKDILRQQPQRAQNRGAAIQREIERCGFAEEMTDLGRAVFGLDLLRK